MPNFPIVDSHVHYLEPARFRYDWLRAESKINRRFGPDDFRLALGGVEVESIVFVEAWTAAGQNMPEAEFVQELADGGAPVAGIVANAPVVLGKHVGKDLARLKRIPLLSGIRYLIEGATDPSFCLEQTFLDGLREVAALDLPFDLCLKHWALPFGTELAQRFPDMTFVLDHIGKPGIKHGLREPWWTGIREMAALPNVVCKVSAVITEADHAAWSYDQIRPYVDHAFECFGFDRVLFGSDWPVSELTHSYSAWVEFLDRVLDGCADADLRKFYRGNTVRTYRLGDSGSAALT
jgi:L-fuconolactonase